MKTEAAWMALKEVMDPEMPINIVDLGLIYGIEIEAGIVKVRLTLTAMGCPASEFILEDITERLKRESGVEAVQIEIVWSPPWTATRLSQEGRDALEAWGLAV
jgi:metal-sulfur cluster biosynthetic enzyme